MSCCYVDVIVVKKERKKRQSMTAELEDMALEIALLEIKQNELAASTELTADEIAVGLVPLREEQGVLKLNHRYTTMVVDALKTDGYCDIERGAWILREPFKQQPSCKKDSETTCGKCAWRIFANKELLAEHLEKEKEK